MMANGRATLDPARHFTGIAKKESARRLSALGLRPQGRTWAKRSHPEPIESERHFLFVRDKYIPDHIHEGGAVYSIHVKGKQGLIMTPPRAKPTH